MRIMMITVVSLLAIAALSTGVSAQEQEASQRQGTAPVEFCDNVLGDKEAPPPGGVIVGLDPGQVLFTLPPDLPGAPFPLDTQDYDDELDALANSGDAYYSAVKNNRADLLLSFAGDPGAPAEAVYMEDVLGNCSPLWDHVHLSFGGGIEDLDGLELWGPYSDGINPLTGWDANIYSVVGDPGGNSVWYYPWGGPAQVLYTQQQIHDCASTLGFTGDVEDIDVDALMCSVYRPDELDLDEIIVSLKAAGNWDGGEIFVCNWDAGTAAFLNHGGHLWDTAHDVSATCGVDTEEVDAIEAGEALARPDLPPDWNINEWFHYDNTEEPAYDLTKILDGTVPITHTWSNCFDVCVVGYVFGLTVIHCYDPYEPVEYCDWCSVCLWGRGEKPTVRAAWWTRADGSIIGPAGPALGVGVGLREGGTFLDVTHDWCVWSGDGYPVEEGDGCIAGYGAVDITGAVYAVADRWRSLSELTPDLFDDPGIEWVSLADAALDYENGVSYEIPQVGPNDILLFGLVADGEGQTSKEILQYRLQPPIIPAVSEWGLIVVALLVMAAGLIVFRRARAVRA